MPDKLKILVLTCDYLGRTGGVEAMTRGLTAEMAKDGHEVTVLVLDRASAPDRLEYPGYEVRYLGEEASGGFVRRNLKIIASVKKVIRKKRIEVVLANHVNALPVSAMLMLSFSRSSLILLVYAKELMAVRASLSSRVKMRLRMTSVSRIIAISRYTRDLTTGLYGVSPEKIGLVPPGVQPDIFLTESEAPGNPEGAEKIVFTVARLVPRKGLDTVIRAMPLVLEKVPEAIYVIGGSGPDEERLKKLAESEGVSDRVKFAGRIDDKTKLDWYDRCSVLVMPSRETDRDAEGFGIVFLEANARKKPVIGGASGGVPDAVEDGVSGWLVDPNDVNALARRLVEVLSNPEEARRVGLNGWKRARQFQYSKLAKTLEKEMLVALGRGP